MVEKRNCSFCGEAIEPGTGKMYVKKDGTVYNFCSNKCKKNRIDIGRVPRRTRWTVRYSELKASSLSKEAADTEEKKSAPSKKAATSSEKTDASSKKTALSQRAKKKAQKKGKRPSDDE